MPVQVEGLHAPEFVHETGIGSEPDGARATDLSKEVHAGALLLDDGCEAIGDVASFGVAFRRDEFLWSGGKSKDVLPAIFDAYGEKILMGGRFDEDVSVGVEGADRGGFDRVVGKFVDAEVEGGRRGDDGSRSVGVPAYMFAGV